MTLTSPGGDGRGAVSDPSDSFEDKHVGVTHACMHLAIGQTETTHSLNDAHAAALALIITWTV